MQNQEKESLKNETKLKLRIAELERRSEATEKEKNAKIRDIELRTKRVRLLFTRV